MSDILEQIKPKNVKEEKVSDTPTDTKEQIDYGSLLETLEEEHKYPLYVILPSCSFSFKYFIDGLSIKHNKIANYKDQSLIELYKHIINDLDDSNYREINGKLNNVESLYIHNSNIIPFYFEPIIPLYNIDPYNIKVIKENGEIRPLNYNLSYVKNIQYLIGLEQRGNCCGCSFIDICKYKKDVNE